MKSVPAIVGLDEEPVDVEYKLEPREVVAMLKTFFRSRRGDRSAEDAVKAWLKARADAGLPGDVELLAREVFDLPEWEEIEAAWQERHPGAKPQPKTRCTAKKRKKR